MTGLRSSDLVKQKPKKSRPAATQQRRPAAAPAAVPPARPAAVPADSHHQQSQQHANHQQQQQQQQLQVKIMGTLSSFLYFTFCLVIDTSSDVVSNAQGQTGN